MRSSLARTEVGCCLHRVCNFSLNFSFEISSFNFGIKLTCVFVPDRKKKKAHVIMEGLRVLKTK